MPRIYACQNLLSEKQQQKFGRPLWWGDNFMGYTLFGDDCPIAGVYQSRPTKAGRIIVFQGFSIPIDPRTPKQQAWRGVYASGVLAWQNLTSSEKELYNEKAKGKNFSGYNFFLREFLLSHK